MNEWTLHWLEAAGTLQPWRATIEAEVEATREHLARVLSPPPLDILVQRHRFVVPQLGIGGFTYGSTVFTLYLAPDNANLERSLSDGNLRRTIVHETNHCLRFAGPGYGWTLGEALVSEGLAGHFVRLVFGNEPEPWERSVDPSELKRHLPDAQELARPHDHSAWFFGAGGKRPMWLGYALGYHLVGLWMGTLGAATLADLVDTPADAILSVSVPLLAHGRPT